MTVGYAWVVARHLRDDARETSRLLGRVFAGLNDPHPDAATEALLDLARQVRSLGIPIVVTDTAGRITALDNAPPGVAADPARLGAWIARLDRENLPLVQPGVGTIHYGALPVAQRFVGLAALQGAGFFCLVVLAVWAYRSQVAAARDRLWAAMARESAHQLGTPLMSLTGWIAYLRDNPGTTAAELASHLQADAERLERVAKRFERIGRPARREPIGLGAVAERVVSYFRPRLDRKSTRLNSSHSQISYAVFCFKKKKKPKFGRVFEVERAHTDEERGGRRDVQPGPHNERHADPHRCRLAEQRHGLAAPVPGSSG